jgi:hypothetical protein
LMIISRAGLVPIYPMIPHIMNLIWHNRSKLRIPVHKN